ncbi:hypothetical protein KIF59_03005 [Enterobacter cloacae subsp. cloacae]|nr:hypothetical protein [Enterobacter cloacae subsp. cloacae]
MICHQKPALLLGFLPSARSPDRHPRVPVYCSVVTVLTSQPEQEPSMITTALLSPSVLIATARPPRIGDIGATPAR